MFSKNCTYRYSVFLPIVVHLWLRMRRYWLPAAYLPSTTGSRASLKSWSTNRLCYKWFSIRHPHDARNTSHLATTDDRIAYFNQKPNPVHWYSFLVESTNCDRHSSQSRICVISLCTRVLCSADPRLQTEWSRATDRKRIRCHIRATIDRDTLHTCKCKYILHKM